MIKNLWNFEPMILAAILECFNSLDLLPWAAPDDCGESDWAPGWSPVSSWSPVSVALICRDTSATQAGPHPTPLPAKPGVFAGSGGRTTQTRVKDCPNERVKWSESYDSLSHCTLGLGMNHKRFSFANLIHQNAADINKWLPGSHSKCSRCNYHKLDFKLHDFGIPKLKVSFEEAQ